MKFILARFQGNNSNCPSTGQRNESADNFGPRDGMPALRRAILNKPANLVSESTGSRHALAEIAS
jgi:hypothetical protein